MDAQAILRAARRSPPLTPPSRRRRVGRLQSALRRAYLKRTLSCAVQNCSSTLVVGPWPQVMRSTVGCASSNATSSTCAAGRRRHTCPLRSSATSPDAGSRCRTQRTALLLAAGRADTLRRSSRGTASTTSSTPRALWRPARASPPRRSREREEHVHHRRLVDASASHCRDHGAAAGGWDGRLAAATCFPKLTAHLCALRLCKCAACVRNAGSALALPRGDEQARATGSPKRRTRGAEENLHLPQRSHGSALTLAPRLRSRRQPSPTVRCSCRQARGCTQRRCNHKKKGKGLTPLRAAA